jgi:hypothetical protein
MVFVHINWFVRTGPANEKDCLKSFVSERHHPSCLRSFQRSGFVSAQTLSVFL